MDVAAIGDRCACLELKGADARLSRRYSELCLSHASTAESLAAGFHAIPSLTKPFAATQAAWRFFNNQAVTLPMLAEPLLDSARQDIPTACDQWVLAVMDWSNLHFNSHDAKAKKVGLSRRNDVGYELLTALAVSDRDGSPLAPLCLEMRAANGVHSTRAARPLKAVSVLDGLEPVMNQVRTDVGNAGKKIVFVIDREADSVGHYRNWSKAGHHYLIRADAQRYVLHEGRQVSLGGVSQSLASRGAFVHVRDVQFQGQAMRQFVAETPVVLHRPARTHRVNKKTGKPVHKNLPGDPLPLRLIVSEIRDDRGKVLARWLLLTSLPPSVDAATVALWYYWRWRIESYHKLLKSAGQQVESWQQQTPEALARRLAVAAMACVVVWRLAREEHPLAPRMRDVLVRLSGRQMKRGKGHRPFTESALLAGLGVLIPMLLLLEHHDLNEIRAMACQLIPQLASVLNRPKNV